MPADRRDNFTKATKQLLAERSGYKCGFPSCSIATIGPSSSDSKKSANLGEAAHITAAALGGPRYDNRLSVADRRSASNGIWMCRHHARLVDVDEAAYSAHTLRLWKVAAERLAGTELTSGKIASLADISTLVMFGFNHVFYGYWVQGGGGEWHFDCGAFVYGNERSLIDEIETAAFATQIDRFIVVESQGDGRGLTTSSMWKRVDGRLRLIVFVAPRAPLRDPEGLGLDFALGDDGDLVIENGDLATVSSVQNAIQQLSTNMSAALGEWLLEPRMGSLCKLYFDSYGNDPALLCRLIKLEFARLATIPIDTEYPQPTFDFVWRVDSVTIPSPVLRDRRLSIQVALEWANHTHWTGTLKIFI
jgi:hypothetical protein